MSANVNHISKVLESVYPPHYANDWDNTGFQVNLHNNTNRVLVCLDVTAEIIQEAAEKGCWMIVSHHPLLFNAVRAIDSSTYTGKCVELLVKNGISLYSAHTSADNAPEGLNNCLADIFELRDRELLLPERLEQYYKLAVSVPPENTEQVRTALDNSGAGVLGNYSGCTFTVKGEGTFKPNADAKPHIGKANELEVLEEAWIQALVPAHKLEETVDAVREAHPYEEPVIDIFLLKEPLVPEAGTGLVGNLETPISAAEILDKLKGKLFLNTVRFKGNLERGISRIAICGGAGGGFIDVAARVGAQLYITGEIKHNQYLEAGIPVAEVGHFDTEKCFCSMMADSLQKALVDVKCNVSVYVAEKTERPYIEY